MQTKTEISNQRSEVTLSLTSDLRPLTSSPRRGFTLTELLLVITIIGIMAGLALSALAGATEMAREQRTRAIIAKIDQLIMDRYETYRTRAVPLRSQPGWTPRFTAQMRLYALRDLMRMEMPDRATDVIDGPATLSASPIVRLSSSPSPQQSYRRQAARAMGANWTTTWIGSQWESSECLYLIISTMQDGDKNALDFFMSDEIGDTDGNGMKEILDGWGQPIGFLRWAPGYTIENGALTHQSSTYTTSSPDGGTTNYRVCSYPDPFDPVKADPRWRVTGATNACYELRPLIFSGGRDKIWGLLTGGAVRYTTLTPPDDPYNTTDIGRPAAGVTDSITNHNPVTP